MPIAKITTKVLSVANPNVEVSTETDADSVILEIYSDKRRYPPVALLPNEGRKLNIEPGGYRFDFNFLRYGGKASMKATVETSSQKKTKSGTAQQGRLGTVAIFAEV